ncbi:MAG TPA: hypothetical protein VLK88_08130 [Gemmatimonadales bacterium]|nr:hypothetical protein [Gemmatimonadales bacterium]
MRKVRITAMAAELPDLGPAGRDDYLGGELELEAEQQRVSSMTPRWESLYDGS